MKRLELLLIVLLLIALGIFCFGRNTGRRSQKESAPASAALSQRNVSGDGLRAYYAAHPEGSRTPVRLYVKTIGVALMTLPVDEIRRDPSRERMWNDTGWWEKGQKLNTGFSQADLDMIFNLKKGEVSPLIKDEHGVGYLFWVIDRKDPEVLPKMMRPAPKRCAGSWIAKATDREIKASVP